MDWWGVFKRKGLVEVGVERLVSDIRRLAPNTSQDDFDDAVAVIRAFHDRLPAFN